MTERKGRLLVALHDELMNGASISILRALPELEELGWETALWVPRPGPAWDHLEGGDFRADGATRPIVSGLSALRQPPGAIRRLIDTPRYLRAYRAFLREIQPDVVHSNSLYSFAEAMSASRAGFPTLLHLHDMAPQSRKGALAKRICRDRVDLSVAVSNACADSYELDGWKPELVYEAAPVPERPVGIREASDPFVVGTVGVISQRKGSDLFVAAAELLSGSGIEFRLVGSPTDPLDAAWGEDVLIRARAAGVVHMPQADVAAELARWDAFAIPSRRDPCPISLLEAMAAGLPCIGAGADGIPEQLGDGAGVVVSPGSSDDLAAAIERVAAMTAAERRDLGERARARVTRRFTIDRQAAALDRAYDRAIELRGNR